MLPLNVYVYSVNMGDSSVTCVTLVHVSLIFFVQSLLHQSFDVIGTDDICYSYKGPSIEKNNFFQSLLHVDGCCLKCVAGVTFNFCHFQGGNTLI